jgi:hypothetical protein
LKGLTTMTTAAEVTTYATRIQKALTDLGFAYVTKQGQQVAVSYKSLTLAADRFALLEVDTQRLPPRVSIPKIETPEVLTHLSAVVGRPVKKLNSVGLTYVIVLQPKPKAKPWPTRVSLPEAPEDLTFAFPFGVTREGRAVWGDLLKTGHLLIGGKPGAGKSTLINAGLIALLRRHSPDLLRLVLVDPKSVELWSYSGLPHLLGPVATKPEEAEAAVGLLVNELERREALFKANGSRSLADYNRKAATPLPLVFAVFDEVTDLVIQWGGVKSSPFGELIRLSSKGRAFGIVLCLATQNPKADILDTLVRENSGVRVALKVDGAIQSRSILGKPGAEALPAGKPGRAVVVGLTAEDLTLQGFVVNDKAIEEVVASMKTAKAAPVIPDKEAALLVVARDDLDGRFNLRELYDHFRGVWSWRQLQKTARDWEGRGWLTKPADATSPRLLTIEVLELVEGVGSDVVEAVKRSNGSSIVTQGKRPDNRAIAGREVEGDPTDL